MESSQGEKKGLPAGGKRAWRAEPESNTATFRCAADVLSGAVEAVIDGNESNTHEREYSADVVADNKVITPETAEVFDHDAVYLPLFDLLHHFEEARSVKVFATPAIVTELTNLPTAELGTAANEVFDQSP